MSYFYYPLVFLWILVTAAIAASRVDATPWIRERPQDGDFLLTHETQAVPIAYSAEDHKVVSIAASDLADDIARVAGRRPALSTNGRPMGAAAVLLGTIGRNPWIQELVETQRLDVSELRGQWETFLIATVDAPWPGLQQALVIVGSDRRGTAFGAYELSQAIGVSPWHWWADVPPLPRATIAVAAGTRRFGPPSVRYRGIFLNDEDWGLQPWAALTHEPENADIGPRTYRRMFELLLRLKANTLWPAMHPSTRPFNGFRENPQLADDYAIVMGSSHAEPMLRNNVGEWKAPTAEYNYVTNRDGVLKYWEERVRENAKFEAIYTMGMRGIHDSNMQGPRTDEARIATLHQIFQDQRNLLGRYIGEPVESVPQMFCAYKEVLELYRKGLEVPRDMTIVWPDDNFGYVRSFAQPKDRDRPGGFGVYYHISYLGRPLSYLWLHTTPPALIWQEMVKAYEHGADRIWIVNVGDLKPAEIGTEFFLRLAWNVNTWDENAQPGYLKAWAEREFGPEHAEAIADIMTEYYRLNFQRRPEHLQWWLEAEPFRHSSFTAEEADARLGAFAELEKRAQTVGAKLPMSHQDAFFQLVLYSIAGSSAANQRYFHNEWYAHAFNHHLVEARRHAAAVHAADQKLQALTTHFNERISGGKWRHFMALEPADIQLREMRIAPLAVPIASIALGAAPAERIARFGFPPTGETVITLEGGAAIASHPRQDATWVTVPGLGRSGRAVTIRPSTASTRSEPISPQSSPYLEYAITVPEPGRYQLEIQFLPTHSLLPGRPLRVAVGINDEPFRVVTREVRDGSADWGRGVLEGTLRAATTVEFAQAGTVRLNLAMVDAGVVVDRLILSQGRVETSYFGPAAATTESGSPSSDTVK